MSTIRDKVRHELRELVPATVYLVVTFNIIGFTKYLLLRDYGINVSTFASSTVLALLAAKAMVVADTLPFMEPFRPRPITYNVLWKTSAYVAAIFAVQLLEDAIRLSVHRQGLRPVLTLLRAPHFWVVQIWMAMVLLVFCTFRQVIRSITPEQALELFVGNRPRNRSGFQTVNALSRPK